MPGRGAYLRNKQQHDQHEFPKFENTATPSKTDTAWIPSFLSSIQGITTPLRLDSMLVLQLGATDEVREARLRQLCQLGWLKMSAVRVRTSGKVAQLGEPSVFSHYEWRLA